MTRHGENRLALARSSLSLFLGARFSTEAARQASARRSRSELTTPLYAVPHPHGGVRRRTGRPALLRWRGERRASMAENRAPPTTTQLYPLPECRRRGGRSARRAARDSKLAFHEESTSAASAGLYAAATPGSTPLPAGSTPPPPAGVAIYVLY
ncbi:unnamed protein product [Urochloa humidicola]